MGEEGVRRRAARIFSANLSKTLKLFLTSGPLPWTIQPLGLLPSPENLMNSPCKHPKVRVVARDPDEDAEYVECQECGEVFDSHEFRDMEIEERDLMAGEHPENAQTARKARRY